MSLTYQANTYPFNSRRNLVYGHKGMVATSSPLAAEAGLAMIKQGGNAIDAAIATAAALTVLEPTSNGIGGDAFALVWIKADEKLYGFNGSGKCAQALDPESILSEYDKELPRYGWLPVTVPGAPAAWAGLSERFGRLDFEKLLEPAIDYAENGYPVGVTTAGGWANALRVYEKNFGPGGSNQPDLYKHWFETFAPDNKAPQAGEIVYLPDHAQTLKSIAQSKAESFYKGDLADRIDQFSRETGGLLRKSDFEAYELEWVEPISTNYKGYTISEIPPNGQGLIVLLALNIFENYKMEEIAEGFDLEDFLASEAGLSYYHQQIEAMKLAFTDGQACIADPGCMKVAVNDLLSKAYAQTRHQLITDQAIQPEPGQPKAGGTVYLATADGEGNMVSFIQSNYQGFGSGLVVPGTGIALNNRGHNFSLDPESDNMIAPGKKPYHTIIPGFLSKDGQAIGPFGVMGGFMQPQGQMQVVINSIDLGLNPQAALDAPRWQWTGDRKIEVEEDFPQAIREGLEKMGHEIVIVSDRTKMGRGQIIWRNEEGVLTGATEPRADGHIAVW